MQKILIIACFLALPVIGYRTHEVASMNNINIAVKQSEIVFHTPKPTRVELGSDTYLESSLKSPERDICNLAFSPTNAQGEVSPPESFVEKISNYGCREQQLLTRLAYFESTWRESAQNGVYKGLFQIGSSAWTDCHRAGIDSDTACALYHVKIDYRRFEAITRSFSYFKDLL